jgi:hypothetical protein
MRHEDMRHESREHTHRSAHSRISKNAQPCPIKQVGRSGRVDGKDLLHTQTHTHTHTHTHLQGFGVRSSVLAERRLQLPFCS